MASLSVASLSSFFSGEQKSISWEENNFRSGHVESFHYHQGIIRGQVKAIMKNKTYKVTVSSLICDHSESCCKCCLLIIKNFQRVAWLQSGAKHWTMLTPNFVVPTFRLSNIKMILKQFQILKTILTVSFY